MHFWYHHDETSIFCVDSVGWSQGNLLAWTSAYIHINQNENESETQEAKTFGPRVHVLEYHFVSTQKLTKCSSAQFSLRWGIVRWQMRLKWPPKSRRSIQLLDARRTAKASRILTSPPGPSIWDNLNGQGIWEIEQTDRSKMPTPIPGSTSATKWPVVIDHSYWSILKSLYKQSGISIIKERNEYF